MPAELSAKSMGSNWRAGVLVKPSNPKPISSGPGDAMKNIPVTTAKGLNFLVFICLIIGMTPYFLASGLSS